MVPKKIQDTAIAIVMILLILQIGVIPSSSVPLQHTIDGRRLYVGGDGPGNYSRINDAINDAENGDTIFIYSGIYNEEVYVYKSVRLVGENRYTTTINSEEEGDVILVTAPSVHIENLTARNGGQGQKYPNDACIEICSDSVHVVNTICLQTNYGIWIRDARDAFIINNTIHCNYDGIWLINSQNCTLRGNHIEGVSVALDGDTADDFLHEIDTSNTVNGKPVYYYKNQTKVNVPSDAGQVILANCVGGNVYGLHISRVTDGVELCFSRGITVKNCKIENTVDFGIRLVHSDCNLITRNEILNNPIGIGFMSGGIWLYPYHGYCDHNIVLNNLIKDNWYNGTRMDRCNFNTFSRNNFVNNGWKSGKSMHVFFQDSFMNEYFDNYWDDWMGLKHPLFGWCPKIVKGQQHLFCTFPNVTIPWWAFDKSPTNETWN